MSDNIFNERGVLRTDLHNVRVPPERQPVLDALASAVMAADEAGRQVKIKSAAVDEVVEAHARIRATVPTSTFMDEWRASVATYRHQTMPSLRDIWPPETVTMAVDEGRAPADSGEGDFKLSPQAPPLATVIPQEALRQAVAAVELARHELRQAEAMRTSARENVAKRLLDYNQAAPTITPERNTRDWIAANNAERARRAAANGHYQPNVTQTAKAMSGGGYGNDIRTRRGGGAAYRRGPGGVQAFTKAQALTITAQRIREANAAKLPSEK